LQFLAFAFGISIAAFLTEIIISCSLVKKKKMAQLKRKSTAKTSSAMFELFPGLCDFTFNEEEERQKQQQQPPCKKIKASTTTTSPLPSPPTVPSTPERLAKNGEEIYNIADNKPVRMFLSKTGEPRIELRKLNEEGKATDFNYITLNVHQVHAIQEWSEKIDDNLLEITTEGATSIQPIELGQQTLLTVSDRFVSVDIRKFFRPQCKDGQDLPLRPTRFGVSYTRSEWGKLRNILMAKIDLKEDPATRQPFYADVE
jgi:hypothetical protein